MTDLNRQAAELGEFGQANDNEGPAPEPDPIPDPEPDPKEDDAEEEAS